jgi:hypothetical protein
MALSSTPTDELTFSRPQIFHRRITVRSRRNFAIEGCILESLAQRR